MKLLVRLTSLVAALFVLSVSGRAAASLRAVPMCGERNESIAAPPPFRAQLGEGRIAAAPCALPDGLNVGKSAPLSPERTLVPDRPERVLSFAALAITRGEGTRSQIDPPAAAQELPGHASGVFRPPRA